MKKKRKIIIHDKIITGQKIAFPFLVGFPRPPITDNCFLLHMKSDQQERPLLGTEQKSELRHLLSVRFQRGY